MALTLALSSCGWRSPESPRPDTAHTSSVDTPPPPVAVAAALPPTPWAVLDQGLSTIADNQANASDHQTYRDHWARARALASSITHDPSTLPDVTASLEDLDLLALASRPEITSNSKSLKDVQALREKTLSNFPGIRDVLAQNLTGNQWSGFVSHFTEGLVNIHTLPVAMKDESSKKFLQSMQQQAMTAAVLTQVHIAYNDYTAARAAMKAVPSAESTKDFWNRYTILMQSLGADAMPQDAGHLNTAQLTAIVTERLQKTDPAAINQWVQLAKAQTMEQNPGLAVGMNKELPNDMTLVAYQPDVMMPLAQKIGAQSSEKGGSFIADPSSFLKMSRWQVRSLLDAPITEP